MERGECRGKRLGKEAAADPVVLVGSGKELVFFSESLEEPLKGSDTTGFEFLNKWLPFGA